MRASAALGARYARNSAHLRTCNSLSVALYLRLRGVIAYSTENASLVSRAEVRGFERNRGRSQGRTSGALVGVPGSRFHVPTPAAILDLDALDRNVARMQAAVRGQGIDLRPHVKTHKSSTLGRLQVSAGAVGVCCATLAEAEAMLAGGVTGLLITSPTPTAEKVARLRALHDGANDLTFTLDSLEAIELTAAGFRYAPQPANILLDVDVGDHRTGMSDETMLREALQRVARTKHLRFRGFQGYCGAAQHAPTRAERLAMMRPGVSALQRAIGMAASFGLQAEIVSGGGTGTYDLMGDLGVFTELQAGSYLVMDAEYNQLWQSSTESAPFDTALFIQVAVISANHAQFVTTDGGRNHFATDAGPPLIVRGAPAGSRYELSGDEHGRVVLNPALSQRPVPGARVECWASHCDPTINLYQTLFGVRGDTVAEIISVDGKGL
jgi:3-hydroxy-D-aspartate aldolase